MRKLKFAAIVLAFLLLCSCSKNPYLEEVKYSECNEVIEFFFKAQSENNLEMLNAVLFTPLDSLYWELEAVDTAQVNSITFSQELTEKYQLPKHYKTEVYIVEFNVSYKHTYEMASENGAHTYYFTMTKDDRLHPWKIYGYNSLEG